MRMPWSKEPAVHLDIKEVSASKAVYQGKDIMPRVRIAMTTEDGQKIDFELDIENAAKLIEESTHAYFAIVPELKTRRHTF
jgi:predicted thioesterase